jgi:hypothetical protein
LSSKSGVAFSIGFSRLFVFSKEAPLFVDSMHFEI